MSARANDFYTLMNGRRSVRHFSPDPVPRELIEVAIQTSMVVLTRSTTAALRNSSSVVPPSLLVMVLR